MIGRVNRKPADPMKSMMMKILWSTILICTLGAVAMMLNLLSLSQAIEIGISILAVMISFICTRHLYLEHQHCYQKEQALKRALMDQISDRFPQLHKKDCIAEYIEQTIESHSNAQIRIETLLHYQKDNKALVHYIERLMQEQEDLKVLENLGLRWKTDPRSSKSLSTSKHRSHA